MSPSLEDCIKNFLDALRALWAITKFQFASYPDPLLYLISSVNLVTKGSEEAPRLPHTGKFIRGCQGVTLEKSEKPKNGIERLLSYSFRPLEQFEKRSDEVQTAKEEISRCLDVLLTTFDSIPNLNARMMDSFYKMDNDALQAKLENPDKLLYQVVRTVSLQRFLERALEVNGFEINNAENFSAWEGLALEIRTSLLKLADRTENHYELIIALNGPLIDTEPQPIGTFSVGDLIVEPTISYAEDKTLERLATVGAQSGLDSVLGGVNTTISFQLTLSVNASANEYSNLYQLAGLAAEHIVDCLRLIKNDDFGILGLEIIPFDPNTPSIRKDTEWRFQRTLAPFIPRRFHFTLQRHNALSPSDLVNLTKLIETPPGACTFKGYRTSLNRFRDSIERYHPDDPQKLLDIAIALEALFLNDGDNKELTYRLATRVARILENQLDRRISIFNIIRDLYNFRSKVAHGDDIESLGDTESKRLRIVLSDAPEILRRALIHFALTTDGSEPHTSDKLNLWWKKIELA